jgi:hypothetical protein
MLKRIGELVMLLALFETGYWPAESLDGGEILLYTGLRVDELVSLMWSDWSGRPARAAICKAVQ